MKKVGNVIGTILTIVIVIFTIIAMLVTLISVSTVDDGKGTIFGYKPYIVLSNSMSGVFDAGDMIVVKGDYDELKEGDIIAFYSIDPSHFGEVVTHKISTVTTYNGDKAFITYGVYTGSLDQYPVPISNVIGVYKFKIAKLGYFFNFLKTPLGYVTIILIPFLILIIIQTIKFAKQLKLYKKEQRAEVEARILLKERELEEARKEQEKALNAQKDETAKMREEIEILKKILEKQNKN